MHPNRPHTSGSMSIGSGKDDPPPPNRYFNSSSSGRSSFAHHLPPPIPSSQPSPRHFYPGSPLYRDAPSSLGHTDPTAWASDRPTSNRSSNRWSPTLPGMALSPSHVDLSRDRDRDREERHGHGQHHHGISSQSQHAYTSQHHRLPPLSDYPSARPGSSWGDPPSTSHSSTSRPPTSYDYFRPSSSHTHSQHPHLPHPQPYAPPAPTLQRARAHTLERRPSTSHRDELMADSPDPSQGQRNISNAESPSLPAGEAGKKKKRRVALSCAECAKRKQKCNRETPCQHCLSRRVPELCVPYTRQTSPLTAGPASSRATSGTGPSVLREIKGEKDRPDTSGGDTVMSDQAQSGAGEVEKAEQGKVAATTMVGTSRPPSMLPTLSVRVGRLEAIVNSIINKVDGLEGKSLQDWRINHAPATTPPPNPAQLARPRAASLISSSQTRPTTGETAVDREASAGPEGGLMTGIDVESSTRNPLPQSLMDTADPVPLNLDYHGTPAEQLQRLFEDVGVSPHKIQDLMSELPPRSDADDLINWFFTKINHIRYPISEYLFRKSFAALYEERTINSAAVLALPLVFVVLAMAIRVAPEQWVGGEEEKRTDSLRMYWNSRMAINMASAVKAENLQLVETRICTGLYLVLMHERRLAEGWAEFRAALTIGQAIGLHRDGTKLGLDLYTTEYRRRLWSYLIHADATYSCLLGRPISIDLRSCDTLPPSNLDLDQIQPGSDPSTALKSPTEPTFATYLILRRSLGEIVAKITQNFQRLDVKADYKDIEVLNDDFKRLRKELPPAFRMDDPDTSWDDKYWYLPVHRYYIQTEILHFIMILHRPWLLRRLKSSRYQLSRQACFEAAVTDYKIRQAWKRDHPDFFETLLGSSFREFNAAMIAGISMIVDPQGPHSDDMRHIVSSFMQEHPHNPRADDFSQKEAAIIRTLHKRAEEIQDLRAQQKSTMRPKLSNERGQLNSAESLSAPGSHAGSQRETGTASPGLGERKISREQSLGTPILPLAHRMSGVNGMYEHGTPVKGYGGFGQDRGAGGINRPGLTPASSGGSEDDQPQRLLDQWLMANTSFGPGSDSTINPFTYAYPGLPLMYQFNTYSNGQMTNQPLEAHLSTSTIPGGSNTGLYADPNLTPTQGLFGLGLEPGSGQYGFGTGTGQDTATVMTGMNGNGNGDASSMPSMLGSLGEDGNPSVFWDRLIDGIVVGQGFELLGGQS